MTSTSRLSLKGIAERRAITEAVVVPMLQGIRDRTVCSTYERLEPDAASRVYTLLSPDTASFRMSSAETKLIPHSTNLQNMAKKVSKIDPLYRVRDIFIPDEGYTFVACDYKGAEALLRGAYSDDWAFVDKLLQGADVHTELGCFLFGVDKITPLQRDITKTIAYASQYRATIRTITLNLNKEADATGIYFSESDVAALHKKLLQMHPLERWWELTRLELEKNKGILTNCFGYRRKFHDPEPDNQLKDGLSFYPQSSIACLMNRALPLVHAWLEQADQVDAQLLLQIHDELLFQCRPECVTDLVRVVTPKMEHPFPIHGRTLAVPVEWKQGPSWGFMKEFNHKEMV